MSLGAIGVAVRALEPILWEFEATPDAIIFRLVGSSKTKTYFIILGVGGMGGAP